MKNSQSHTFLWKENYVDYLWATNVSVPSYFQTGGLFVYENLQLSAFANEDELSKTSAVGEEIFEKDKYQEIFEFFLKMEKDIGKKKILYDKKNIQKLSDKELYSRYLLLFDSMREFVSIYRFTEPHYLKFLENSLRKQLNKIEKNKEKREYLMVNLLSEKHKFNKHLSDEIYNIASFLKSISSRRFRAKRIDIAISNMAEIILRETARRYFLAISQVSNLSKDELEDLLINKKIPDINKINKRKTFFALSVERKNGKTSFKTYFEKEKASILKKIKLQYESSNPKIIKGSTGYPGNVTGEAFVLPAVSTTEEYEKLFINFPKNKILVTSMTSPELVPIFSKVLAIITDEGGITSHAALVAREMRKPCIIGTACASKIIKSGARIEVDATNGRILILNNHKKNEQQ